MYGAVCYVSVSLLNTVRVVGDTVCCGLLEYIAALCL